MIPQRVTEASSKPKAEKGQRIYQFNPNTGMYATYEYCKAGAGINAFDAIMRSPTEDGDCDVSSTASKTIVDATKSWSIDQWVGYLVTIIDGSAPIGETLRVISNTATTLTLGSMRPSGADKFSSDLDTTNRYSIHDPTLVVKTASASSRIIGVSPIPVAAGQYFWLQVGGRAIISADGSTNALVAGEGVVGSATAGTVTGYSATTTADEAGLSSNCVSLHAVNVSSAALVELR